MSEGPLSGIKVIEYGNFISAPYCVKLMTDMGAEGIKIEDPYKPDSSRQHGPFPDDVPHHERSGLFLFLNSNKLGVTLNLEKTSGKKIFKELIETNDVLIENNPPGYLEGLGLGYSSLREINPRFIMASITPFGQTGPYKDYKAYGINSSAASGWSNIIGKPGREPLSPPLSIGYFLSGTVASVAVLCALFARDIIGEGQLIDISDVECWNTLFTGTQANAFIYYERKRMRHGHRTPAAYPYAVLPCKDGYMWMAAIQGYQWKHFLEIMGDGEVPEWYRDDPRFKDRSWQGETTPTNSMPFCHRGSCLIARRKYSMPVARSVFHLHRSGMWEKW